MAGLLEERELRLDRHRVLGHGLDDARAEALDRTRQTGRPVAHAAEDLVGEKLGSRVEPDAQHAPTLCRQPLETLPEAARHARQATVRVGPSRGALRPRPPARRRADGAPGAAARAAAPGGARRRRA